MKKFRIFEKYRSMPVAVRAAFWFTFCSFLQQAISFITTPIFTRIMSSKEYGIWTLFSTWMTIFTVIVTLNLQGGGFNNAMVKYENARDRFLSSMIGLTTVLTGIWIVLLFIFGKGFEKVTDLPVSYLFIMFVTIAMSQVYLLWAQEKRYDYQYRPLILATVIISVLTPVISILFVYYSKDKVYGRLIGNLIINLIVSVVIAAIIMHRGRTFYDKGFWKFALCFNIPLIPHYLSQIVLASSDRIMIGRMCGEEYAAYYGISYNIATIVNIILNSICSALTPWVYEKLKAKSYENIAKIESALAIFFVVITMIPILVGPEVIAIMAPNEYKSAVWVIPPVSCSVYFMYLYNIYANIEFFYEQKRMVAIGSVVTAGVNIVLNYIFIGLFGFVAAGYTTLICYMFYSVCHFLFSRKVLREKGIKARLYDNRLLMVLGGIAVLITVLSNFLFLNNIVRYITLAVMAVICMVKRDKILGIIRQIRN